MATHTLKCWLEPFAAVMSRRKKCELRKNDRNYQEGDVLNLLEYDPNTESFSGSYVDVVVTHLVPGGEWGLPRDVVAMSIEILKMGFDGTLRKEDEFE